MRGSSIIVKLSHQIIIFALGSYSLRVAKNCKAILFILIIKVSILLVIVCQFYIKSTQKKYFAPKAGNAKH